MRVAKLYLTSAVLLNFIFMHALLLFCLMNAFPTSGVKYPNNPLFLSTNTLSIENNLLQQVQRLKVYLTELEKFVGRGTRAVFSFFSSKEIDN